MCRMRNFDILIIREDLMKKPVLVIMAAGMGSRYGGMKQVDPIDEMGHIIMDFSVFDARRAGFEEVIFIIKREMEEVFREVIGDRISRTMKVHYVYQELSELPGCFTVPEGRVKPWGTGHAVLCAASVIDGPFAVINADDYYGTHAFKLIYDALCTEPDTDGGKQHYVMIGYHLKNTLTENGSVARGVCTVDEDGRLSSIEELTRIIKTEDGAVYSGDEGKTWTKLDPDSVVSMNMWGFPESFLKELGDLFPRFLEDNLKTNPLRCEYFLPFAVNDLMKEHKADVTVMTTPDVWHGVTYAQDKQSVVDAMQKLREEGVYPKEF